MYGLTKEDLSKILPSIQWAVKEGLLKSNKRALKAYVRVQKKYYKYLESTMHYRCNDEYTITEKYLEFKAEEYNAYTKYGFNFTNIHAKYGRYKREILDKILEEKKLKEYIESRVEGTPV